MTNRIWVTLLAGLLLAACGGDDETSNNSNNGANNSAMDMSAADMAEPDAANNGVTPDMGPDLANPPGVERRPNSLSVFPPVPTSCDNPGAEQRIPFVFGSTDVIPVVAGDVVGGRVVSAGHTVHTGTIGIRRPRISTQTETTCTLDSECNTGFKCAAGGLPGAPRQCTKQTGVELVPRTARNDFDPGLDDDKKQLVAVLIENTAMLEGRLPLASGSLYDDAGEKDLFVNADRASDPTRIHRASIKDFMVGLASVAKPTNTAVSIWWYAGQVGAEARPLVDPGELSDHFTNDLSIGEALIDEMPDPVPKPANLYQGMLKVVESDLGLDKYADHEKFLYVFTDGINEVHDDEASYAKVLETMEAQGIHVFIVHLDAPIDPTTVRDLNTLYAGNNACQADASCAGARACTTDTDCQNYESCRTADVYPETEGGSVTQTASQYCMPAYDQTGRLGPVDLYADMACRTGGNYIYVSEPEAMRTWWRSLPVGIDGQFSIAADFSALSDVTTTAGFYRWSAVLLGMLGSSDVGVEFTGPVQSTDNDSRPIVRVGRVRN